MVQRKNPPSSKYGFPGHMLCGALVGGVVAVAIALILANHFQTFRFSPLVNLLLGCCAAGAYLGHIVGATRFPKVGYNPIGPITNGVITCGAAIVFGVVLSFFAISIVVYKLLA